MTPASPNTRGEHLFTVTSRRHAVQFSLRLASGCAAAALFAAMFSPYWALLPLCLFAWGTRRSWFRSRVYRNGLEIFADDGSGRQFVHWSDIRSWRCDGSKLVIASRGNGIAGFVPVTPADELEFLDLLLPKR